METEKRKSAHSKFWFGFSLGLLIGIFLMVGLYFTNRYLNDPIKLLITQPQVNTETSTADSLSTTETAAKTSSNERTARTPKSRTSAETDSTLADADTLFDSEFALSHDDFALTDEVVQTEGVAQRKIRVINHHPSGEPEFTQFEVERWSDYAKNRCSYQRTGNELKIKGLDIQKIKIVYTAAGEYALQYNGHTVPIPENEDFARLNLHE